MLSATAFDPDYVITTFAYIASGVGYLFVIMKSAAAFTTMASRIRGPQTVKFPELKLWRHTQASQRRLPLQQIRDGRTSSTTGDYRTARVAPSPAASTETAAGARPGAKDPGRDNAAREVDLEAILSPEDLVKQLQSDLRKGLKIGGCVLLATFVFTVLGNLMWHRGGTGSSLSLNVVLGPVSVAGTAVFSKNKLHEAKQAIDASASTKRS